VVKINKTEAYVNMENAHRRYKAMSDSTSPIDRANAEALRLATQEWQAVAMALPSNLKPDEHLANITNRWRKYLSTGVPDGSIDESVQRHAREHQQRLREHEHRLAVEEAKKQGKEPPSAPSPPKPKKVKLADLPETDHRRHVDPKAIEGVLNEFRHAFDMPMVEFR
jgi:hypothetical protein